MYEFTIPEDVEVLDSITEKPTGQMIKAVEFYRGTLLTDRRFSHSSEALESQNTIRQALRGKGAGDKIVLHPNDYNLLADAAKKPQYGAGQNAAEGYGAMAYLCLPFIDAILGAKKVSKKVVEDDEDAPPRPAKKRPDNDD